MNINWSRAFWWIFFAFALYAVVVFFMAGCASERVMLAEDRAAVQHDENSVLERDMVPEEKER